MAQKPKIASVIWDDRDLPIAQSSEFISNLIQFSQRYASKVNIELCLLRGQDGDEGKFANEMRKQFDVDSRIIESAHRYDVIFRDKITNSRADVLIIATNTEKWMRFMARARTNGVEVILLCDKYCKDEELLNNKLWKVYCIDGMKILPRVAKTAFRRRSRSPPKEKRSRAPSRSPEKRERSKSPVRYSPKSSRKSSSPKRRRSPTPKRRRSPTPKRGRSPARTKSPVKEKKEDIKTGDFLNTIEKPYLCIDFVEKGFCEKGYLCKDIHKCKRCLQVSISGHCEMECEQIKAEAPLCRDSYFCLKGIECPFPHTTMEKVCFMREGGDGKGFVKWKVADCRRISCPSTDEQCSFSHGKHQYFCVFCVDLAGHYEADCPTFAEMEAPPMDPAF